MSPAVRTTWSEEQFDRAMSLRGRVSAAAAGRICGGIPGSTIARWWKGQRPRFKYAEAQAAGEYFVPKGWGKMPEGLRKRRRAETKARSNRRYYYRQRGVFHRKWNPDPALAPLNNLWFPGESVLEFIRNQMPDTEARRRLRDYVPGLRRFDELTGGRQPWLRYDSADAMFCHLGLVLSEMDLEPMYSGLPPKRR